MKNQKQQAMKNQKQQAMKRKNYFKTGLTALMLFSLLGLTHAREKKPKVKHLSKAEVLADIHYVDSLLSANSSYQGLNGYDYKLELERYMESIPETGVRTLDFGVFLTQVIAKIGDRHSSVRDIGLSKEKYLPYSYAPLNGKVIVVNYDKESREYKIWDQKYPYLQAIDGMPIRKIMERALVKNIKAPRVSFFSSGAQKIRDYDEHHLFMTGKVANKNVIYTMSNEEGQQKKVEVSLVKKKQKEMKWRDDCFMRSIYALFKGYKNEKEVNELFKVRDGIGCISIPTMASKEEMPKFFHKIDSFIKKEKDTKAMILDLRGNGGGTRDLINCFAGHFVHPDSIYVVNVARQRAELPLNTEYQERLKGRYLQKYSELNKREQKAVDKFLTTFTPMYKLDDKLFSENYYYILNGRKLGKHKNYYSKPVYLLVNEFVFSAASVFTSVFKGLPNVTIAGIRTDGSSGNSKKFLLPNSGIRVKLSTMVSFQKNGLILDGYGTAPDITLKRDLDQILWKKDTQLEDLIQLIK